MRETRDTITYTVPGIHCEHCERAIRDEVLAIEGVQTVDVQLETKVVAVSGQGLSDERVRAAIAEAGYEAA